MQPKQDVRDWFLSGERIFQVKSVPETIDAVPLPGREPAVQHQSAPYFENTKQRPASESGVVRLLLSGHRHRG